MDRYTRKDAETALARLAEACKREIGYGIGQWHLDYNSTYGGYVVHQVVTEGGGVATPFGSRRRTAREFCSAVSFAYGAVCQYADGTTLPRIL